MNQYSETNAFKMSKLEIKTRQNTEKVKLKYDDSVLRQTRLGRLDLSGK